MIYLCSTMQGFLTFILSLLFVAFFMLSERNILACMQLRKGPNKAGLKGLFQSIADFLKLISKCKVVFFQNRSWFSWFGVFLMSVVALCYSLFISFCYSGFTDSWALLGAAVMSCLSGYGVMSLGLGSYNKYAQLSSIRCCFVSVSFEAFFMCCLMIVSLITGSYSSLMLMNDVWILSFVSIPLFVSWLFAILGECGRTPFDYLESESEMVSGMKVEYSKLPFACMFACEYIILLLFSWMGSMMFFGGFLVLPATMLMLFFFMWCRGSLPRARFDFFVKLMWNWVVLIAVFLILVFL